MKILVTGTAGFIGFHLSERLLLNGHLVVGIDQINDYYDVNLKYDRLIYSGIDIAKELEGGVVSSKSKNYIFLDVHLKIKYR